MVYFQAGTSPLIRCSNPRPTHCAARESHAPVIHAGGRSGAGTRSTASVSIPPDSLWMVLKSGESHSPWNNAQLLPVRLWTNLRGALRNSCRSFSWCWIPSRRCPKLINDVCSIQRMPPTETCGGVSKNKVFRLRVNLQGPKQLPCYATLCNF